MATAKIYDMARMTTATTGTGTITLGSVVSGFLTFAGAGVANGDIVFYAIEDGNNREVGTGTYTSSGTTLTRTVLKSTNANAAISLSGSAQVFISPLAEGLTDASNLSGSATLANVTLQRRDSNDATLTIDGDTGFNSNILWKQFGTLKYAQYLNGSTGDYTLDDSANSVNVYFYNSKVWNWGGITNKLGAGTATIAPLQFTSGTNLTTATAGSCEYDGVVFYHTPTSNCRGVVPTEQFLLLNAAYTLTSQTAAQKLFNASTNGAVTLPVGTFEFECEFSLTAMSSTSGSFGFALGGTATFTQAWWSTANKPTTSSATAASPQTTYNTAANTAIATATTNTTGYATIKGIIRVTVAGTIIPQVSLGVAAAAIVGINSFFKIKPLGSSTVTKVGNWS